MLRVGNSQLLLLDGPEQHLVVPSAQPCEGGRILPSYTLKPNRGRRIDRDLHPWHHDVPVVTQRVKNNTILYRVRPYRRRLALVARPETTGKGSMELPCRFTEQLSPFGVAHHLVYDYYHI